MLRSVAIFIAILAITNCAVATNATFGECLPNSTSCTVCYKTLKESLLGRDDNIQQLSKTFYPPRANIPQLVEVTYYFGEISNTNNTQVWFWTQDSSYLFFPIQTFQYLSMFFGKPAEVFTRKMNLILDEDCLHAGHEILRLLTQRVSIK